MALRSLYVDFNSYFASVEQQDDPRLRGRPVGVVPVMAESTCCIAASIEAKPFGVKTGTLVREARERCPGIVIVQARPKRYVELHHALNEAIESCIPIARVASIDEVACHLLGREQQHEQAIAIARRIKAAVRGVGDWMRCSVGIAPNDFLAKTASDMQKPDGLVVLEPGDLPQALHGLGLSDLCGIGPAMLERLHRHGITRMEQLCAASGAELRRAWGGIEGERFHRRLRGEWIDTPAHARGSVGHSHVLAPEMRNEEAVDAVLSKLLQKAASRLRRYGLMAGAIAVKVKYRQQHGEVLRWESHAAFDPTNDSRELLHRLRGLAGQRKPPHGHRCAPLAVGVTLVGLRERGQCSGSLFDSAREAEGAALNRVVDRINQRYGLNKIYFGSAQAGLGAAPMRIAFSQIPDVKTEDESERNELWLRRLDQARVLAEAAHRRRTIPLRSPPPPPAGYTPHALARGGRSDGPALGPGASAAEGATPVIAQAPVPPRASNSGETG